MVLAQYRPKGPPPEQSRPEFEANIKEEWAKIPAEILQDLIVSMPKRCRQVINIDGDGFPTERGDEAKKCLFFPAIFLVLCHF